MNTTHPYGERSIQLSIIISLLLHILFVLYCITKNPVQQKSNSILNKTEAISEQLPQKNNTEWVETKQRPSHGGAPIFFHDDVQSPEIAEPTETKQEETSENTDITPQQEPILEKEIDIQKTTSIQSKKPRPSSLLKNPHQPKIPTIKPSLIKSTPTPAQKNLPSLAQLTQGMLNYMKEEGKHSVSMLGKKNGIPTDEQLKYERYLERLNQCLQTSFSINSYRQPAYAPPEPSITVYLALNEDGSIYNLKLIKTCGNQSIDLYVMSVIRDASSSFPPVPRYLPHNPFSIHYIIGLSPHSSYR